MEAKFQLRLKKGTVVIGVLAIIIAFLITLSCIAFVIMEYSNYVGNTKTANEAVSTKLRESLVVVQTSESEITVTNEGSMPSVIIGIYAVNPANNNPQYDKLEKAATIGILSEQVIQLPENIPIGWKVGILTSLGNVFWEGVPTEGEGGLVGSEVPPGEPVYVTFAVEGLESDASGTVLVVEGSTYERSDLPKTFPWVSGDTRSFEWKTYVSAGLGKRYVWVGTKRLSTEREDPEFNVFRHGLIIAKYSDKAQYKWTFDQSGVGSDANGPVVKIDGKNYYVGNLPKDFWWEEESSHTYQYYEYVGTSADGKRYTCPNPPSGTTTVASSGSQSATYHTEYKLTMNVNPLEGGSISPSSGWYDAGSSVTISASPASGYVFDYWTGSGSGSYSGTSNPATITMNGAITETASFVESPWLEGWQYRVAVTIDNTHNSETLTDYQVLAKVNTASLVSAGKMRPDCGDIRFTDSDATALIPYWIEPGMENTANTKIWVKTPSIPRSSTKTIYMYYGNPAATSMSNGRATFDFFDDFDDGDLSDWSLSGYPGHGWGHSALCMFADSSTYISSPYSMAVGGNPYKQQWNWFWATAKHSTSIPSGTYKVEFWEKTYGGSYPGYSRVYINGYQKWQRTGNGAWRPSSFTYSGSISSIWLENRWYGCNGGIRSWFDNILIRKYISPEPTVSLGPEESA